MLILLTGGARSGKSAAAVQLAARQGAPVAYVATAEAGDDEMAARIAAHRRDRPAEWSTIEAPTDIVVALASTDTGDTVIIDCLGLWVTNLLHHDDDHIEREAVRVIDALGARAGVSIVVTNEVGSGVVPDNALARRFRDTLGRVNARFAAASDRAWLCAAGRVLELASLDSVLGGLDDEHTR